MSETQADIGEYCRAIEDHLTRVNAGHLVRVVGPAFELAKHWAEEGVPLSVVCRGIDLKAERHRTGASKRPLRLEFCEADVREIYETWRRSIGVSLAAPPRAERQPALGAEIARAIDRLGRVSGRVDLPDAARDAVARAIDALAALRERAHRVRGEARDAARAELAAIDAALAAAARAAAPAPLAAALAAQAAQELAAFRGRLSAAQWQQAIDRTVERLLRERWSF